jgi:hypothetical protein
MTKSELKNKYSKWLSACAKNDANIDGLNIKLSSEDTILIKEWESYVYKEYQKDALSLQEQEIDNESKLLFELLGIVL